ncbi:putative cadmium-transporting ATPase [bacterium BMS3Abin05]|nr:putative cadmium-transporting ATPase [bacterium BMS3Abin05]GBE28315.1 putative cadmium-transporting ATPase [bacterium BMS3Bbin03]HDK35671.1 cadmium-translocating P-type ATPase [Bacteroidota bacterium]HDZ12559.1 cadmium-translocating P-type ATPase [Bacteroidota bacterium]
MEQKLRLEIPVLLPEVKNERDQCVERLLEQLKNQRGFQKIHIDHKNGESVLCLHYDPNLITLEKVGRIAKEAGAQISRQFHHETLHITGMDCPACALSIEHILGRKAGIMTVSVNYAAEKMRVEYDTQIMSHRQIVHFIQGLGYRIAEDHRRKWYQENWQLLFALFSGFFLTLGFIGQKMGIFPGSVVLGAYLAAYFFGGFDATRHGIKAVLNFRFDIDFLMVVAAVGAAVLGDWVEGALLLFLFSMGHALEHFAMDKARNAIKTLGQLTPKVARVQRDGSEIEIPVEQLQKGDIVIVRPGERVPIDGQIIEGHSTIDESPITGESIPVEKNPGKEVFAGSINGEGALEVKTTKLAKDTTLARVIQLVEEAQTQKSPTQRFTEKFETVFVPIVLAGVLITIFMPPFLGWLSFSQAFLRGMTLLVAASPCALAIATPSAVLSGIARAARSGVLIKGGVHLENLGSLRAISFDKTGTITVGKPEVVKIVSVDRFPEKELLKIAASLESRSQHPLAEAILRKAASLKIELYPSKAVKNISGKGIIGTVNKQPVRIGNLKLFKMNGVNSIPKAIQEDETALQKKGFSTMLVRSGDKFLGLIAFADQPRPKIRATLQQLKKLGIRALIMLTGDNKRVAATIAQQIGITEYHAELLPEEKAAVLKKLLRKYKKVAMVGDGVNDAPALASATVGIAMGAGGTDVALETADIALMSDDISKLPFAVALSRQSRRIILQNLIIALGVVFSLIPVTLIGSIGISTAILFHEGSTLIVVANALRLLKFNFTP